MSDAKNKPDERLEPMLRRWGAEEAVRCADVGPAPQVHAKTATARAPFWLRWAPTLAAAAILLVAPVMFIASGGGNKKAAGTAGDARQKPSTTPAGETADQSKKLLATKQNQLDLARAELKRTGGDLQAATTKLAEAENKLAKTTAPEAHKAELAKRKSELKAQFETASRKLLAEHKRSLDDTMQKIRQRETAIAGLKVEAGRLQSLLESLRKEQEKVRKDLADANRRRTAAAREYARLRKNYDKVAPAAEKRRTELLELKAPLNAVLDDFQRIYLAAASPGEDALAVRQKAAVQARIIQRCAMVRREASASAGKLVDRIEVVFTQLDMLDPYAPRAAEAFAALVRSSGLLQSIDKTLAAGGLGLRVRAFLFEAKLILTGVERVG